MTRLNVQKHARARGLWSLYFMFFIDYFQRDKLPLVVLTAHHAQSHLLIFKVKSFFFIIFTKKMSLDLVHLPFIFLRLFLSFMKIEIYTVKSLRKDMLLFKTYVVKIQPLFCVLLFESCFYLRRSFIHDFKVYIYSWGIKGFNTP